MASRKLTALPTATEVTTSDKIYIVDVSDTTESPQGTSKQATVEKVVGYKELVMLYTSTGELDTGTAIILKQDAGFGTVTVERSGSSIGISSNLTPFTANKTVVICNFVGDDTVIGLFYNCTNPNGTGFAIQVLNYDATTYFGPLGFAGGLYCTITIRVYP